MIASGTGGSSGGEASFAGLCATCVHARRIRAPSGAVFILCRKSEVDDRFERYPRLPVLECSGHDPGGGTEPPPKGEAS